MHIIIIIIDQADLIKEKEAETGQWQATVQDRGEHDIFTYISQMMDKFL